MAARDDSAEARGRIRADIQAAIEEAHRESLGFHEYGANAREILQKMILETPGDFAAGGLEGGLRKHLCSHGGGFMGDAYDFDIVIRLSEWLGMTPEETDAAFEEYTSEQALEYYDSLVAREFLKMAALPDPEKKPYLNVRPYEKGDALAADLSIHADDGSVLATVPGLPIGTAKAVYEMLADGIRREGGIPATLSAMADIRKTRDGDDALASAIAELGKVVQYVRQAEDAIFKYATGRCGDDAYYGRMNGIDRAMKGNLSVDLLACELADQHLDAKFAQQMAHYADAREAGKPAHRRAVFTKAPSPASDREAIAARGPAPRASEPRRARALA